MNPYFTLQPVGSGIWAVFSVPGSGSVGNAAIIDLGGTVVIVDTFGLPEAASYLKETAEQLTGQAVDYVINTHYHGDHHYGNQVFSGISRIISTEKTRDFLTRNVPADLASWQSGLRGQIASLQSVADAATDFRLKEALHFEISEKTILLAATPEIRRVTADLTFTDEMVLYGKERLIRLITFGGGHTLSDAMVYIPDAGMLIAGDLVLGRFHPAMLHGDAEAWRKILDRIEAELLIQSIIPGHGFVTDGRSLEEMRRYLRDIEDHVRQAVTSGETVDFWLGRGIPSLYDEWQGSHVYEWNFRWLYDRMKEGSNSL
ncbi:MBL fold metallo-hydrolase [Gorillibacterium massiliense]|uniref:MBL fold metallo-hydrolase n=1 Tax=Gorillibacterium massiliense TaxID=1280390 RepID=UPI0004B9D14C|nr:MBL fold metallo-hydrolase [Gorillibacterium massiliense]